MAKIGVQPITTASLPTSKIAKMPKMKAPKATKPNTKMMSALFGNKTPKASVQSVPTKTPTF